MNRRRFLATVTASLAAPAAVSAQGYLQTADLSATALPVWEAWKSAYMMSDGRIVDRLQQNASHSEGQGYGMVLATEFGDADAFRRMFDWTERNLAIRPDALLAWRFLPDQTNRVPDPNNATDGDLFYAWALLRAARRFNDRAFMARATDIARDVADKTLVQSPAGDGTLVMLPAVQGFQHDGRVVINPSYLMPLAMRELAAATGMQALAVAAQQGEALALRLADAGTVPDWIEITANGIGPAAGFSTHTGYEAMRVPLFLIWSGQNRHPAVQQMMRVYERTVHPAAPVPTRIESASGAVLEASNDPGYRALAALVSCAGRVGQVGSDMPPFDSRQPYYPATLQMFAMIAANQVTPECVPI